MQILRTILTVIFAIDCIALTVVVLMAEGKQQGLGGAISGAADSYWGKNKGRSREGLSCQSYHDYGSVIFCTGSSFEYEFLRIVRRKHSCMVTRVLFFSQNKGV